MTKINPALIPALNESLEINLPENSSSEQLKEKLRYHINHLIQYDFQKLVAVLYRVDVDEMKLKHLLKENTEADSASIIADLFIERQLEKIKSRQQNNQRDKNISDDEKW